MASQATVEDLDGVAAALKLRVAQVALRDVESVEPRAGTLLEMAGLASESRHGDADERGAVARIVAEATHPQRLAGPVGPLVAIERSESERLVVDVAVLLVASDPEMRRIGLAHFRRLGDANLLTPKTRSVLNEVQGALAEAMVKAWGPPSIRAYDAVKDDILSSIAGLRQSLALQFDDGIDDYLKRTLRPTVSSLDSIDLGFWKFDADVTEVQEFVDQLVHDSANAAEALAGYCEKLGHAPLGPALSAGALARAWIRERGATGWWDGVWQWAKRNRSPLATYHACVAGLTCLGDVPPAAHADLVKEAAGITDVRAPEDSSFPVVEAMSIRRILARHYIHHLECCLPGADSDRIALMSSWLTERVSGVFEATSVAMRRVRTSTLEPQAAISEQIWKLAHPSVSPSRVRYATLRLGSMWSFSLLRYLLPALESIDPAMLSEEMRTAIDTAVQDAFRVPWVGTGRAADTGYAFEMDPVSFVSPWLRVTARLEVAKADSVPDALSRLVAADDLVAAMRGLPSSSEIEQVLVSHMFMARSYEGTAPDEAIWDLITTNGWLERMLIEASEPCVHLLFEGLREITLRRGERWAWTVPQIAASAYEKATNAQRQETLFAMVVLSSIATGTVAGLQRILGLPRPHEAEVKFWRDRIEEVRKLASPWAAARLRSAYACLA